MEGRLRLLMRVLAAALAVAVVGLMASLIAYVTGEDAYLGDGTSRWRGRADDADARGAFWVAVGLSVTAVALLLGGVGTRRLGVMIVGSVVAGLAALAFGLTYVAFTAN